MDAVIEIKSKSSSITIWNVIKFEKRICYEINEANKFFYDSYLINVGNASIIKIGTIRVFAAFKWWDLRETRSLIAYFVISSAKKAKIWKR